MHEQVEEMTMMTVSGNDVFSKMLPEVHAVDIEFQNIVYTIEDSGQSKRILRNLSGKFKSGELTAVLGPSGAGKTTLLNLLAGYSINDDYNGVVLVNGRPRHPRRFRRLCSYIMQEALVQPHLNVLESMLIASRLKVANLTEASRLQEVQGILQTLGIADCARTRSEVLSGGQRKRFTIALELVSNPSVLFLDEPTTGLDTYAGKMVMRALANLAAQGRTIICTVHQPCPLEFKAYDNVYVVARGSCVFSGPPSKVVPFLQEAGTPCPQTYSPADYIIELVQMYPHCVDHLAQHVMTEQAQSKSFATIPKNTKTFKPVPLKPVKGPPNFTKLNVLLKRMLLQRWRNKQALGYQLLHHVLSGFFCGFTFFQAGMEANQFLQNIKLCLAICVFYVYTYLMVSILYFPLEVELVKRENFNNWYGSFTYYIAYSLSNIPAMVPNIILFTMISYLISGQPIELSRIGYIILLGCLSAYCSEGLGMFIGSLGSIKNGCILGPAVVGPLFALSCYGIGYGEYIEPFMVFLMKTSFMRYSLVGLWIALFGLNREPLNCSDIYCHWKDPQLILRDLGLRDFTAWSALGGLLAYTVFHRIIGYAAIRWRLHADLPGAVTSSAVLGFAGKVIGHFRNQQTVN